MTVQQNPARLPNTCSCGYCTVFCNAILFVLRNRLRICIHHISMTAISQYIKAK